VRFKFLMGLFVGLFLVVGMFSSIGHAWWNSTYDVRYPIQDQTSIATYVNGTGGWKGDMILSKQTSGNLSLYEDTGTGDYAVANDTTEWGYYTTLGSGVSSIFDSSAKLIMPFDDGTTVNDISGNNNDGTNNGATQVDGLYGKAYDFDGSDDYIETGKTSSDLGVDGSKTKTVSAWVYTESFNGGGIFEIGAEDTDGEDFSFRTLSSDNEWKAQFWGSADIDFTYDSIDKWVHFVVTWDGTTTRIYADGSEVVSADNSLDTGNNKAFKIGKWSDKFFDGKIDDVRIYNRALSSSEIEELYNNSQGLNMQLGTQETNNLAPDITISSPTSKTYKSTTDPDLNFEATDDSDSTFHVKAYSDTTEVYDNTSYSNGTTKTIDLGDLSAGEHNVTVWANDSEGQTSESTVTYTINRPPSITLNAPTNGSFVANSALLNVTYTDPDGNPGNVSFYGGEPKTIEHTSYFCENNVAGCSNSVDNNWTTYASAGVSNKAPNTSIYINYTYNDIEKSKSIKWKYSIYSDDWNASIALKCFNGSDWKTIDEDSHYDEDTSTIIKNSTVDLPNSCKNQNTLQTKTTVREEVHIGFGSRTNFYEQEVKKPKEISNSTNVPNGSTATYNWTGLNDGQTYEWYATADDNTETFTSPTTSFTYYNVSFINQAVSDASPLEGQSITFNLTLNASTDLVIDANLTADGTVYDYDTYNKYNHTHYFEKTLTVDNVFDWNWTYSVIGSDNDYEETTTTNTVNTRIIAIDNCSTYNTTALILDLYNETLYQDYTGETQIEIWFESVSATGSSVKSNYSVNSVQNDSYSFCIPNYGLYNVFASLIYQDTGSDFTPRNYYLVNATLSNNTETINLYMLDSTLADEIEISVQNSNLLTLDEHYVRIQRKDTSTGSYKTVSMGQTDENGRLVADIEKGSSITYKFIVIDPNGNIVDSISPVSFSTADTSYTITTGATDIFDIWNDIDYSCEYINSTKKFVCDVTDTSGLMTVAKLKVERKEVHSWEQVCEESGTSSSVTLVCELNASGDFDATKYLYNYNLEVNGVTVDSGDVLEQDQSSVYGLTGLFLTFMLVIISIFIGAFHPAASVLAGTVSIVLAKVIGLIAIGETAIVGLVFVAGIIIIRMGAQRR